MNWVFLTAGIIALSTIIGTFVGFCFKNISKKGNDCVIGFSAGVMLSAFGFRYFPSIRYAALDMTTIPFYTVYFGLCITPEVLNFTEERKWKTIYSKM